LHAPGIREVVDIGRADIGGDRLVDLGKGHPEGVRLLTVERQHHLRGVGETFFPDAREDRALARLGKELVARRAQVGIAVVGPVLEAKRKAVAVAEP